MTVCTIQRVMKPVVRPPEGPAEAAGMGDDALRVQSWPYLLPCCGAAAGCSCSQHGSWPTRNALCMG